MRLVRDLGSLRNEVLRDALHVEIEVLIGVHVRGGDVRLSVVPMNSHPTRIHAVHLFRCDPFEGVAKLLNDGGRCSCIIRDAALLRGQPLWRHLGAL